MRVKDEVEVHYMKRRSDCKFIDVNDKRIDLCGSEQTRSGEEDRQEPIETLVATSSRRSTRCCTRRTGAAVATLCTGGQRTQALLDRFERWRIAALVRIERETRVVRHQLRRAAVANHTSADIPSIRVNIVRDQPRERE